MNAKKFTGTVVLLMTCTACESAAHREKREHQEQAVRVAREMGVFSARYKAITDWQQSLKSNAFSVDVEPIFLRADHRPVLFYAALQDIKREQDAINLYFLTTPTEGEPTLQLVLECDKCDLQKLKKFADSGDFGVVAEPVAISKAINGPEDGPDFTLKGKFIEAQFIGDYAFNRVMDR